MFAVSGLSVAGADTDTSEGGKELYISKCSLCHGERGEGDGRMGRALRAANLAQALTSRESGDAKLIAAVMDGRGAMPAWKGVLSEAQVKSIFVYIESIR